jgi:hypothetical protein
MLTGEKYELNSSSRTPFLCSEGRSGHNIKTWLENSCFNIVSYGTMEPGSWLPAFRANILPPSSGCHNPEDHSINAHCRKKRQI